MASRVPTPPLNVRPCTCGARGKDKDAPAGHPGPAASTKAASRRSLRIAIVTHAYYPQYGGVTEHVHHTSLELTKKGHNVTIITCGHRNHDSTSESQVIRLGSNILVPYNGAFVNLTVGWNIYGKMNRLLRHGDYDVVHIHCPLVPVLPLAATRTSRDSALFGTFHASGKSSAGYLLFRPLLKKHHRKLDGRIAVSNPARDFVSKYFGGDYRIIPNGVDPERFKPDNPRIPELDDGRLNVLFVGRPDPRKGLEYLIRAMEIVMKECRLPVRLVVVGEGPRRRYYEEMAKDAPPGSVSFVGSASSELLPSYFASAHVFSSPATMNESFGIVLLEAMASGLPVVASSIPGYRTVVSHGEDGLLTTPGDVEELAKAILLLLNDERLRREMGRKGQEKAARYSWKSVTEQIESYYFEILNARERVAP